MEIINLGVADGLPPVNWDAVIDKLDAGIGTGSRRAQHSNEMASDHQWGR